MFPSDKLLVTNRPKAAAEGSGLRPLSYPRNGRGPLPEAAARAPLGFAALYKVEVRVAQFHSKGRQRCYTKYGQIGKNRIFECFLNYVNIDVGG